MKSNGEVPSFITKFGYKASKESIELNKVQKGLVIATCLLMLAYSIFSGMALSQNNIGAMYLSFFLNLMLFIQIALVLIRKEIMYKRLAENIDTDGDLFEIQKSNVETKPSSDPYFIRLFILGIIFAFIVFILIFSFIKGNGDERFASNIAELACWIFIFSIFFDGLFEQILIFYSVEEEV